MKHSITILLLFMLALTHSVHADPVQDSIQIYFHDGSAVLDLSLRHNRRAIDDFVYSYQTLSMDTANRIHSILIESHASPSGTISRNKQLAQKRAASLLQHLRTRISLPDSLIHIDAKGVDWEGLITLVEQDPSLPAKEAVLHILRHTPLWVYNKEGRIINGRKKQLMDLQGGRIYRLLDERYFALLRNTYLQITFRKPTACMKQEVQRTDTVRTVTIQPDTLTEATASPASAQPETAASPMLPSEHQQPQRLALKTNLLYDAVLMPSLEVEYRLNDRWSVNLEGNMAWWKNKGKHKYYQLATVSPEGRYWFKSRKPWHGHYLGLFGGFSWYDLENGHKGRKGEAVMSGISYGYMFPLNRSLSLEAGVGVGWMHTWYEEYLPIDGHYVYQQSSKLHYFGPLKLKLALVWRLDNILSKKGGSR